RAPVIRVWAGDRGSMEASENYRQKVIEESRRIASMASRAGIRVAYEYHNNTLTDTDESAYCLLKEIDHPSIRSYWQPSNGTDMAECASGLEKILPWLENVHVFYWTGEPERVRQPLKMAVAEWSKYLEIANRVSGDLFAMLEFVKGDSEEQFYQDAETLKGIIEDVIQ
ncbi:MAG TPA: hypothetical protein VKY40_03775, partial [Halanaerobiales bacterium]|nr:hypothetical protein [Halanaerobiales bacterium]